MLLLQPQPRREALQQVAVVRLLARDLLPPLEALERVRVQQVREDIEQEELDRLAEEEEAAKEAAKERRKRQQEARDAAIAEYGEGGAKSGTAAAPKDDD